VRILIVDIGNSSVIVAGWSGDPGSMDQVRGGALSRLLEAPTPRRASERQELVDRLEVLTGSTAQTPWVLASVVPEVDRVLLDRFSPVVRIDHTCNFPFGLKITNPRGVGADRYCNIASAVLEGWRGALVVDAGTATTFDLLLEGEFAGGLIAPGMAFAARALGEAASRLEPVVFAPAPLDIGRDTAAALRLGCYHVAIAGVSGVIEALLERFGRRPVVLTGGLGRYLAREDWRFDADWTLRGALFLAAARLR
jgi:type III pantothenate kinase